ncbi:unnamed protein product [Phytophthora fragariaefolia]|uniref:Unnamed protein product n=1 Tax=Phytophthora fragariaefolia TaxID=1490495 RepID=A0A9W6U876_9STRA|nr:unnamed protein product [Phytophthora fragariaefolia]
MQDHQCDSYSAFSTESFGNPEPSPAAASMLFSRSPPSQASFLDMPSFSTNYDSQHSTTPDNYAGFSLESLAPPIVHRAADNNYKDKTPTPQIPAVKNAISMPGQSDYGHFASFAQPQPEEEANPSTTIPSGVGNGGHPLHHFQSADNSISDEYASFANLTTAYTQESQNLAARGQQATTLSRSPTSAASNSRHFDSEGLGIPAANDYGSFASLASELEDKRPQWGQSMRLPLPPITPNQQLPRDGDVYGNFASLSLAEDNASAQDAPSAKSLPTRATPAVTPNSDVYGSFDGSTAVSASTTTPTTSALDELNVGMEFYKQKRLDDALLRFMLAQEMARSTGDQVVEARALGNLGTVYLDKKNPHQAVRCYQQCLDITRAIEDTKRERTILNNLVLALVASEDFERALACCQVQLETTTNAINRRKIISRMSLLREKMARQTTS